MPPRTTLRRPERSLEALGRLREKVRRAFMLDGAVTVAAAVLLLLWGTFFLDYLLRLPPGVRAVLLALLGVTLAWVIHARLIRPRLLPLGDEDLAVLVESRSPELKESLVTAVQLTREGHAGAVHLSPELIAQAVGRAEASAAAIQPSRVLDLRPAARKALAALALLGLAAGGVAARPDLAGIWAQRLFLLSAARWPKNTELVLVHPTSNRVALAMGDDLPVEVQAVRGAPAKVQVEAELEDGSRFREPMMETTEGSFQKLFQNVNQPFRFRVVGGDDELPEVEVQVRVQPSLTRLDAWYLFPKETGLPHTAAARPVRNPALIQVPAGTRVAFRAYTDLPVKKAFVVFKARDEAAASRSGGGGEKGKREQGARHGTAEQGTVPSGGPSGGSQDAGPQGAGGAAEPDATWPDPSARELAVESASGRPAPVELEAGTEPVPLPEGAASMFDGEILVDRDGHFYFQLLAPDDLPGRRGKVVSVRAIPDRKPLVRITLPGRSSEEVSAEATVAMEFFIRDDYGVKSASLEGVLFPSEGGEGTEVRYPLELALPEAAPRGAEGPGPSEPRVEHRPRFTLEVQSLKGAAPGARFLYHVQATDQGGLRGESERYTLHVMRKEDLHRIFQDQIMMVRDQLKEVARQEESARKDLQALQQETEAAPGGEASSLGPRAVPRLGRHRQDQERVSAGLGRADKAFRAVLAKMEANRVGQAAERDWIEGLRKEVESLATDRSPQVEKKLDELRHEAQKGPQPPDRLSPITQAQSEIERDIQMLVLRLSEFGDLNAIVQQLRELQRRQTDIRNRTRSRAGDGAGEASPVPPGEGGR